MTSEDLRQRMLKAQTATTERLTKSAGGSTSPLSALSTNETLFLADSGWEPLDICCGAAVFGMRQDTVSTWGPLQDDRASEALAAAMATAVERLQARCVSSGVHGVIGTEITTEIQPRYVAVSLVGTGIRPVHAAKPPSRPFTSNLSPRDFILLQQGGWNRLVWRLDVDSSGPIGEDPPKRSPKSPRTSSSRTRPGRSPKHDPRPW